MYSTILVALVFFLVGTIKGKMVKKSKIKSGLFTLIIGGIVTIMAYSIGYALNSIVYKFRQIEC
jgi:VIT1/CCC1 family predicted Fe2+/Mn2+ transporter